jgi:hypothetical protein
MSIPKVLKSGRADKAKLKPKEVDQKQLKMGIKVEMEHTNDSKVSKDIAMDHLAEIPDYYSRLKSMEASASHLQHPQLGSRSKK